MTRAIHKNLFFLLFFLCCCLPIVAARLALDFGWFTAGATNKGEWFKTEIKFLPDVNSLANTHPRWHLVYVQSEECDQSCDLTLYTLQQLYKGLAARQDRVDVFIMAASEPAQLIHFQDIKWQFYKAAEPSLDNRIVLVNPEGVALLHYPGAKDSDAMVKIAKDIRTDLLRLLSFERSGS